MKVVAHSLPYKEELDGLRGVAILLVVFFHLWPEYYSFGYVGVDIFFVLSGYLITKIIYIKKENGTFSYFAFYRNRIRRIFPALILVITATLIFGYLFLFPSEYELLGKHVKSSALFYQNFRLLDESGYWDKASQLKPLLHFWSLSIEEQFYIFWPLIVAFSFYIKRNYFLYVTIFILLALAYQFNSHDIKLFYHSLSRFWELGAGGVIVYLEKNTWLVRRLEGWRISVWIFFIFSIGLAFDQQSYNFFTIFCIVLATMFLLLSLKNTSDQLLGNRFLIFFGLISYPLYLWHYPIISYAHIFNVSVEDNGILILFASVFLAWGTYRFVEIYARKQTDKLFIATLVVVVLSIGGVGGYIDKKNGMPDRSQLKFNKEMQLQFQREQETDKSCLNVATSLLGYEPKFDYCRSTSRQANAKYVALIGDSHAHVAFPGFAAKFKDKGYETIVLSNSGCVSFIDGGRGKNIEEVVECEVKIENIYSVLESLPNLEKVIIVGRGPKTMYGQGFGDVDNPEMSPIKYRRYYESKEAYDSTEEYFTAMKKTFDYFEKKALPAFILLENPELGFSPEVCLERPYDFFETNCKVNYAVYKKRMAEYRENVFQIAENYSTVKVLDPEKLFCDRKSCYAIIDGKMMYADDDHLSVHGSFYQANGLIEEVLGDGS